MEIITIMIMAHVGEAGEVKPKGSSVCGNKLNCLFSCYCCDVRINFSSARRKCLQDFLPAL